MKKFLYIFFFFPILPTFACGPTLTSDEVRFCLFRPDLGQNPDWFSFFYTERYFNDYVPDPNEKDKKRNIKEWRAYLHNKQISYNDIYQVLYAIPPDAFALGVANGEWGGWADNNWIKSLENPKNEAILKYLITAKKNELAQTTYWENWNNQSWENRKRNPQDSIQQQNWYLATEKENEELLRKASDPFLQQRYAYLLMRLPMQGFAAQKKKIHDTYLKGKNTIVADWGYYFKVDFQHLDRAAHIDLIRAFDKTYEKRLRIVQNLDRDILRQIGKSEKEKHLKSMAYTLAALINPGRAIKDIRLAYQSDSNMDYLPLLITREINKLESWLLTKKLAYFNGEHFELGGPSQWDEGYEKFIERGRLKDLALLGDLRHFLVEIQAERPDLAIYLSMALAHVSIMEGEYDNAKIYLAQIPNNAPALYQTQKRIENLICLAHTENILLPEVKEKIAADMKVLEKIYSKIPRTKENNGYNFSFETEVLDDLDELMLWLSRRYMEKGDVLVAGLLYVKKDLLTNEYDGFEGDYDYISFFDRHATPTDIDELLAWKHQKHKTNFDCFLDSKTIASDSVYWELKGTLQFREGDYEAAYTTFAQLADDFWEKHGRFKEELPKYPLSYLREMSFYSAKTNYQEKYLFPSKKLMAKEMCELAAMTQQKNHPYYTENLFQYANALYNITYNGSAWMMFSYGKTGDEKYKEKRDNWAIFYFEPIKKTYLAQYYECKKAIAIYQKLAQLRETKPEIAVKAEYMLRLCKYSYQLMDGNEVFPYKIMDSEEIKKHYGKTLFYEEWAQSCPDIFLNQ